MADLLIRDLAMPKDRNTTLIIYCDGTINLRVQMEDGEHLIPITAKAVPLPEGHGRLIDADELMEIIRAHDYPLTAHFNSTDNGMFTLGIQQAVDEVTTIVPAEGGTDECSEN